MGQDWSFYQPGNEVLLVPRPRNVSGTDGAETRSDHLEMVRASGIVSPRPVRNVYACLVHEARDCVLDLCRNLRHLDPDSTILLYNGGSDPALLAPDPALDRIGVVIHPNPRRMRWGSLHDFALDCMRFALAECSFDTLTIVDSDQLALRAGWTKVLGECLAAEPGTIGLLGNRPERLSAHTDVSAARTAWQEVELWRPFLRRFPEGENMWVHWTFWPSTVFTAEAARALVDLFDHDQQLQQILRHSRLWVTEEILFPTLTALLGFGVARSPGSYDYVRYGYGYSPGELEQALARPDAYWIHSVPRRYDDPLRTILRARFDRYDTGGRSAEATGVPSTLLSGSASVSGEPRTRLLSEIRRPILTQMREVSGWLGDDEADLLITMTDRALETCPDVRALVEVGSFRGKGTTVLAGVVRAMRPTAHVWAVDPHDGVVGALDQDLQREGPTLETFRQNVRRAGLEAFVETVQARAPDVAWSEPICLLLIDGLHDYASVSRDFRHFEPFLVEAGLVAFHDYADYYPGVRAFVDELINAGSYLVVDKTSSLIVLCRRVQPRAVVADESFLEARAAV
jgi:hypothetical protein